MPSRADLQEPRRDACHTQQPDERRTDRRERETTAPAIETPHRGIRVGPAGDVPHDEAAEQQGHARDRIAERSLQREPFVETRPLLAEEPIRTKRRREAPEAIERE